METIITVAIIYLVLAVISIFVTVLDKSAAKARKRRVPERVLFFFAGIGGALPMLLTMKIINHKTRHKRFMLGLPAIILVQALLVLIFLVMLL